MARDSLKEKLQAGGTALGVIAFDPYSVDVAAHTGFDWIFIDQMFTALDWTATESLIRCCEANGITPVVRVQSNPWLGYDHRISVDVTRLLSIGTKYIIVSNSGKREIEECLVAASNWHKRFWVHTSVKAAPAAGEDFPGVQIIPQPETAQALAELPETLALPGINLAFIGTTDPSMALSKSDTPNFYSEELWKFVERKLAEEAPKARDARVLPELVVNLVLRAELWVRVENRLETGLAVTVHRAKFVGLEKFAVFPEAVLGIENRPF